MVENLWIFLILSARGDDVLRIDISTKFYLVRQCTHEALSLIRATEATEPGPRRRRTKYVFM